MKLTKVLCIKIFLSLILIGVLCYGALFGVMRWGAHDEIKGDPQVMIVLGCRVMPSGVPSMLLKDRLDEAYTYWAEHPQMTIVVSGGQGSNEPMTEAQCMAEYLVDLGVPSDQILQEGESHNTNQNIRYSKHLLYENGFDTTADMMVVSNDFHLTRTRLIWSRASGTTQNLSVLAAPCSHEPSKFAMDIREPIALVKSFVLDHYIELGESNA